MDVARSRPVRWMRLFRNPITWSVLLLINVVFYMLCCTYTDIL